MTDHPNQPTAPLRRLLSFSPLLIALAAVVYYGCYLRYHFNPHDEGGTAALTAQRLLAGEVPMRDVELGYNVMWFWPIVALFKVGGINFLLMRGYFFALSTLTALTGWALIRRMTRNEWLALAVGIALVIFPGSQFKNYNPLLCVANMLCLVQAALAATDSPGRFRRSAAIGGLVLGLSLLVRIDIGYLFTAMWLGVFILRLLDTRLPARGRGSDTAIAAVLFGAAVFAPHVPVYLAARAQGFDERFVRQYPRAVNYYAAQFGLGAPFPEKAPPAPPPKAPTTGQPVPPTLPPAPRTTLRRMDWSTFASFQDAEKSVLYVLTYLPLLAYIVLIAGAVLGLLRAWQQGVFALDHPAMLALLVLGSSLTTFPQFFFFRPDRPHLSEFMPGYIVATMGAVMLLGPRGPRAVRWIAGVFFSVQFLLFGWYALDHYSAGTIAARTSIKPTRRKLFEGANGVRVIVAKKEYDVLEGVRKTIVDHAPPGEWVVCYPYQPGYNLMTDRPTYERDLYIDNATAPRGWSRQAIARIVEKRPAVIVLDDRAINGDESSRFSRWAAPVSEYVRANYQKAGSFDSSEIYVRDPLPESK